MCKETYSIWVDFIVQLEYQQSSITDLLKVWWTTSSKSDLRKLFLRLKNKSSNCNMYMIKKTCRNNFDFLFAHKELPLKTAISDNSNCSKYLSCSPPQLNKFVWQVSLHLWQVPLKFGRFCIT